MRKKSTQNNFGWDEPIEPMGWAGVFIWIFAMLFCIGFWTLVIKAFLHFL